MKNKSRIHYLIVLDESGSMDAIKDTVISSYNEQVEYISKIDTKKRVKVSLCTFNDTVRMHSWKVAPKALDKLTYLSYRPDSCTALYDAIGMSVERMLEERIRKDELVLIVFTDGMENASRHYNSFQIDRILGKLESEGHTIKFVCTEGDVTAYKTVFQSIDEDCFMSIDYDPGFDAVQDTFEEVTKMLKKKINKD